MRQDDRVKDRVDQKIKTRTRTWMDMVKDLTKEDELETTNLDKSGSESKGADLVKMFDSRETNQVKAKRTRGHQNSMSMCWNGVVRTSGYGGKNMWSE